MVPTGPWELPDIISAKVDYGVVPMPTFSGKPVTISGPDTWMVFDNGSARAAGRAEFVTVADRPRAGRDAGTWRPAACRCAGRPPRRTLEGSTSPRPRGWTCSSTRWATPACGRSSRLPEDLRGPRPVDRRSAARQAVAAGRAGQARSRPATPRSTSGEARPSWPLFAHAPRAAPPRSRRRARCASACSARRRARGCSSRRGRGDPRAEHRPARLVAAACRSSRLTW